MKSKVGWIHGNDPNGNRRIRPRVLLLGFVGSLCLVDVFLVLSGTTLWPIFAVGAVFMGVMFVLNLLDLKKMVEVERFVETHQEAEELRRIEDVRMSAVSPHDAAKSAVDQEWDEMQKDSIHLRNLR